MTLTIDHIHIPATSYTRVTDTDTGETYRVELDESAESPLEWGWDVTLRRYTVPHLFRADSMEHDPLTACFERVRDGALYGPRRHECDKFALAVTRRYAALIGDTRHVSLHPYRGYSQSDWAYVIVIADNEQDGKAMFETWSQWMRGDVYYVTRESDGESLGGIYADHSSDAVAEFISNYA